MPAERRDARGDAIEHLARGEIDQAPDEVEAQAAHTGAIHRLELGIGDLFSDEGDALGLARGARERIDQRAIVLGVARRLHDHVLVEAEKVAQREQLFLGCVARRVFALGRVGKFAFRTEHMAVRIDGARRRNVFRLRRIGMKRDIAWTHRHGACSFAALQIRSSASETPCPTPTHMVASASLPPRFSNPCTAVKASRAPDMPSGCPSAIAPPCGLTCSAASATPSWRRQASPCEAKASLISIRSKSPILRPSRCISLRVEGTGPIPITRGGTAADAMPSTRARGVRPWRFAASAEAMITAAAPSLMPEALPAVMVPGLRTIGLSLARPSSVVSGRGCSSFSTTTGPPLPPGTSTGTISSAK